MFCNSYTIVFSVNEFHTAPDLSDFNIIIQLFDFKKGKENKLIHSFVI